MLHFHDMQSAEFENGFCTHSMDVKEFLLWVCSCPYDPCIDLIRLMIGKDEKQEQLVESSRFLGSGDAFLARMRTENCSVPIPVNSASPRPRNMDSQGHPVHLSKLSLIGAPCVVGCRFIRQKRSNRKTNHHAFA